MAIKITLHSRLKPEYRIVLIYLVIGVLWIFLSDALLVRLFDNLDDVAFYQNLKGWFFIVATAGLLFLLIRHDVSRVSRLNDKLVRSYDQTVLGWIRVMDVRNKETRDHTERVTRMAVALAKHCGVLSQKKLKRIERGAILHDLGKIGISDGVLTKPGKLTEEEWSEIRCHPQIARDILVNIDFLSRSISIPYCHHEKWDSTGYPQGLKGKEIPREARIFAVVDVWDALIHPRIYKDAWPETQVLDYLREQSGKHFDPAIVQVFLDNYEAIKHQGVGHHPSLSIDSV